MAALFTITTSLGAALLFLVEPMAAKGLLPWLGGSASVWTVCLVFFQSALLGGYLYAHLLARRLSRRQMAIVHGAVTVLAAALLLVRGTTATGPVSGAPALWILLTLGATIGLPFLVLAATGPLLQRWLAELPGGRDPYPLYAVSNAASLAALLAYPLLVERYLPLAGFAGSAPDASGGALTQNALWAAGFLLYAGLVVACAVRLSRVATPPEPAATAPGKAAPRKREKRQPQPATTTTTTTTTTTLAPARAAFWMFLAFVPTVAMLGTTQALTADVASVPLLWVLPLAVYLISFVLAFARPDRLPLRALSWATAALALGVAATQWIAIRPPPQLALPLFLATLFAVALLAHGRLARERPPPAALTGFYLCLAAGGALGSVFCGLLAPVLFDTIVEFPLALVLACLCRTGAPASTATARTGWRARPALIEAALVVGFAAAVALAHLLIAPWKSQEPGPMYLAVGISCLAAAALARWRRPFAVALAALFVMGVKTGPMSGYDILVTRSFFGVHRVKNAPGLPFATEEGPNPQVMQLPMHELYHGATMHGIQLRTGDQMQLLPTAYFHPQGPIGRVIAGLRARPAKTQLEQVGVVGLGVGTLAAYALPGERFTFFEIDSEVVRIARDPSLFTYLQNSPGTVDVQIADGRIGLTGQPDGRFNLIVIDAFSSDAVPVHLMTLEAVALILRKLRPDGVAAFNLSSGFFDLPPVLAESAAALGKEGLYWYDEDLAPAALAVGKLPSAWVVLANDPAALEPVRAAAPWTPLSSQRRTTGGPWLWTDRYSSPLAALKGWGAQR